MANFNLLFDLEQSFHFIEPQVLNLWNSLIGKDTGPLKGRAHISSKHATLTSSLSPQQAPCTKTSECRPSNLRFNQSASSLDAGTQETLD